MQNNEALSKIVGQISAEKESKKRSKVKTPSKSNDADQISKDTIPEGSYDDEWLELALEDAEIEVYFTDTKNGITYHYVDCPNKDAHQTETKKTDSKVYVFNGYPCFKCHHGHCTDWKFADYAQAVGIDYVKQTGRAPDKETHYFSDFYEWRQLRDGSYIASKVIDAKICEWICRNYDFFVMADLPYYLDDHNCYKLDDAGVRLKRLIQSCIIPRLLKNTTVTGIYNLILFQDKRKKYDELNCYPIEWVPFQNGFYDPIENKIVPILPEHFVINMIPHEYDPDAVIETPVFNALLDYQLPEEDARELWLEFCGSCFNRDTSGQKWMIIRGRGGTGKSVQINLLAACIGEENIANETLQGLSERFNATNLFGRLVNLCADISSEDLKRIDVLKKITGQDKNGIKHEKKGKDCFFFTAYCKLLFSANTIPLNRDEKSNAFYRRLLITVMDRKPEKVDRNLQKKLMKEVDGVIHRYMEGLQRFYERGGYYPESKRSKHEVMRLRQSADSVFAFLMDNTIEKADGMVKRSDLYELYEKYCNENDRLYPVTRQRFYDRLRDEGYQEKIINGYTHFTGLDVPYEADAISGWQRDDDVPLRWM